MGASVLTRLPPTITCRRLGASYARNGLCERLQPVNTIPAAAAASLMNCLQLFIATSRRAV